MKTMTVRDLRYNFPAVERALRRGQTITITKRGTPVGQLSPAPSVRKSVAMPDFMARLKTIYGDKVLEVSTAELQAQDRERF